jgi:hypothetical protein
VSPQRPDRPSSGPNTPSGEGGSSPGGASEGQNWRWLWGVVAVGIVAILLAVTAIKPNNASQISYTKYMQDVKAKLVNTAQISNATGVIIGKLKDGTSYQAQGPSPSLQSDVIEMRNDGVQVSFPTPSTWGRLHLLHRPPDPGTDVGDHVDRPLEGEDF